MKYFVLHFVLLNSIFFNGFLAQTGDSQIFVVDANAGEIAAINPKAIADERVIFQYLAKNMKDAAPENQARLAKAILKLSRQHRLPSGLILSVIRVESNFRPWAVSNKGAVGLMQIMPETAEWIAKRYHLDWAGSSDLLNEECNLSFGVQYLAYLHKKYQGNLRKILSAYNQGPAKIDDDVEEGRSIASTYYEKVKEHFPTLALRYNPMSVIHVD